MPSEIREIFLERSDDWSRLQIVSDGDGVPWELLCPPQSGQVAPPFIAERFPLCRWVPGRGPERTLRRQHPCLVTAPDASPATVAEVSTVQRLLNAHRESVQAPARSNQQFLEHLDRADFDWLHFAGHHSFDADNPSSSALRLGQEKFQAVYLSTLEGRWDANKPFVFLNGCRTAGASPLYTRLDGWASRCLRAGAAAFAGTSWAVRNDAAFCFAEAFYCELARDQNIGNAFFQARIHTRDAVPDDMSWLAYVLYGHAAAMVSPLEGSE